MRPVPFTGIIYMPAGTQLLNTAAHKILNGLQRTFSLFSGPLVSTLYTTIYLFNITNNEQRPPPGARQDKIDRSRFVYQVSPLSRALPCFLPTVAGQQETDQTQNKTNAHERERERNSNQKRPRNPANDTMITNNKPIPTSPTDRRDRQEP